MTEPTDLITLLSSEQVLKLLGGRTPFDNARQEFGAACGRIEQAQGQRTPISIIDIRRMEFEAVRRIAAALGG